MIATHVTSITARFYIIMNTMSAPAAPNAVPTDLVLLSIKVKADDVACSEDGMELLVAFAADVTSVDTVERASYVGGNQYCPRRGDMTSGWGAHQCEMSAYDWTRSERFHRSGDRLIPVSQRL